MDDEAPNRLGRCVVVGRLNRDYLRMYLSNLVLILVYSVRWSGSLTT